MEVWGIVHTPWLFSGGIDIKAGQWVTLEGVETIDPTTNYLYSHSFIFNFGIPFVETGIMTISHVATDFITACNCNPNNTLRFLNDITATCKVTDSFTLITDANDIHDDGTYFNADGLGTFHPIGYGMAQYAVYKVNDWLKLVGRA